MEALAGKHIVLGVTGSIACYKAVELASRLVQRGALVDTILTPAAGEFVTPLTFRNITHRMVVTDLFDRQSDLGVTHVALAEQADIVVVAPATAHILAAIAHGLADDALTVTALATRAPLLLAPAMDGSMWSNPATRANVDLLRDRGAVIVGPGEGHLASGLTGVGRMEEPAQLMGHITAVLGRSGDLAGKKVVVSAGGTQEPVDPVRVVTNLSSGKMGYALAEAARDRGANVVLVAAPNALSDPAWIEVIRVKTAIEMQGAIMRHLDTADVLLMAAAVADYRPVAQATQKVKKGATSWELELTKNPDILAQARKAGLVTVGFAAESESLVQHARLKLEEKALHLIVANDITATDSGFASDNNRVVLLDWSGDVEELPLLPKYEVGHRILDKVTGWLTAKL